MGTGRGRGGGWGSRGWGCGCRGWELRVGRNGRPCLASGGPRCPFGGDQAIKEAGESGTTCPFGNSRPQGSQTRGVPGGPSGNSVSCHSNKQEAEITIKNQFGPLRGMARCLSDLRGVLSVPPACQARSAPGFGTPSSFCPTSPFSGCSPAALSSRSQHNCHFSLRPSWTPAAGLTAPPPGLLWVSSTTGQPAL